MCCVLCATATGDVRHRHIPNKFLTNHCLLFKQINGSPVSVSLPIHLTTLMLSLPSVSACFQNILKGEI